MWGDRSGPVRLASVVERVRGRLVAALAAGRATVLLARDARVPLLAASVAYFAFISLVPLMLLVLVAATVLGRADLALATIREGTELFSPTVADVLRAVVASAADRRRVTLVGGVVLLWAALRTFRALDAAFGEVYADAEERGSFTEGLLDAAVGLGAISLAGIVVFVTVVVLQLGRSGASATALLFVGFAVVFYPMYYLFPRTDPAPLDVVPGTVVAAGTWTGFQTLFDAYVTAAPEAYDALGAVLLVLTWLYVSSLVLLVGAALNAVLGGRAATL